MMTGFIVGASALLALALIVLLRPLLRHSVKGASVARAQINARIYRNQLVELETDRTNGVLDSSVYDQSKRELERRALDDIQDETSPAHKTPRWPAVVMVIIAPVAAILTYVALGNPAAMVGRVADEHANSIEGINRMVADLAQRLENNPDDLKGWVMLGRSYKAMGRFPEAVKAFERAGSAVEESPQILVDFAEVMARSDKEGFRGRGGMKLIERALKLSPDYVPALVFAGSEAFERTDYPSALRYWQKAVAQLPPDSEEVRALNEAMSRASSAMGQGKTAGGALAGGAEKSPAAVATKGAGISGTVSIAPALLAKAKPDDSVFLFARAAEGPRAPLAVIRATVKDLPLKFALDDTQAMSPELRISLFKRIRVEARVSRSGNAAAQSGDLQGASDIVASGAKDLRIAIDQQVP